MVSSHYLDQCWNTVNLNLMKKLQWNLNWNSFIFFKKIAFENVVCKKSAILSRPQYVNLVQGTLAWLVTWGDMISILSEYVLLPCVMFGLGTLTSHYCCHLPTDTHNYCWPLVMNSGIILQKLIELHLESRFWEAVSSLTKDLTIISLCKISELLQRTL